MGQGQTALDATGKWISSQRRFVLMRLAKGCGTRATKLRALPYRLVIPVEEVAQRIRGVPVQEGAQKFG